ncbi:MAG TPA: DUF503 domain-containing protein [bacterium]|nr:DUF503 domain-containing protein [bacterium]
MTKEKRPYLALLTVTVRLEGTRSLKEKRMVVRSLKDVMRARFGAAVAEVDGLDDKTRAVVALAGLATARRRADALLAKFENHLERRFGDLDLTLEGRVVEL